MDTEQIKILLERYNQGNCSPEEADIIDKWFEHINRHQSTILDKDALHLQLDEVKLRINDHITPAQVPGVRNMRPWYWSGAAAAAVLLAAGIFWFGSRSKTRIVPAGPVLANTTATGSHRLIRNGFVEITTGKGSKDTIALEDGSSVVLNAGSKLRHPVHFSKTTRTIYLDEGEAFFDAAHDASRSFVVCSGDISTTALGTSFNIRSYASENKVTVALISGKVKIDQVHHTGKEARSLILLPSEQLSYDRQLLSMVKTSFGKPEEVTGWKQGYLVFRDAPYNEIVTGIENRYGVTVINQSDKTEWKYTGFFKNESLADVMDIICLAKSLSYTIKKDTVYLVNKN